MIKSKKLLHKRQLCEWLQTAVDLCCLTRDDGFELAMKTGRGTMHLPEDIADYLFRKGVLEKQAGRLWFTYQNDLGESVVEVIGEQRNGIEFSTNPAMA